MSVAPSLPRPRIGIVSPEGAGDPLVALAARAVELALLHRLPAARVAVAGTTVDAFDLLIVLPGAVAEAAEAPVVRLPGDLLAVAAAGPRWMPVQLGESLLGTLRLLGRAPAHGPFLLCDPDPALLPGLLRRLEEEEPGTGIVVPSSAAWHEGGWAAGAEALAAGLPPGRRYLLGAESGPDQVIAAAGAAAGHAGADPLLAALVSGEPEGGGLDEALDVAVAAAVAEWVDRGMPGGRPDAAVARRAGTERALLQCLLLAEERRAAAAEAELAGRLAAVEAELALTTRSASWRLTRPLRAAAQALRGRRRP